MTSLDQEFITIKTLIIACYLDNTHYGQGTTMLKMQKLKAKSNYDIYKHDFINGQFGG